MNVSRTIGAAVLGLLLCSGMAAADGAGDLYQAVKTHVESMKDYTLQYDYHGPRGDYKFDYRCVRPRDIRCQVVAGSNTGAVVLYQPELRADKLKARKGLFTVWKDYSDETLKGTPFEDSVFDMALKDVVTAHPTESGSQTVGGHDCTVLTFNNGNVWYVDKVSKDILRWIEPEPGGARSQRDFYNIRTNTGCKIQF